MLQTVVKKVKRRLGKDGDTKEIAKGGAASFLVNMAGMGFGYIFVFVVSKIYGEDAPGIYGQYILVTMILRMASIASRSGMDTYFLQQTAGLKAQNLWYNLQQVYKKLLLLVSTLGLIISVLVWIFSGFLASRLKVDENLIKLAALFITPMALGIFYAQGLRGFKKIAVSTFLRSSSLPILNLIFLLLLLILINRSSASFKELPSFSFFIAVVVTLIFGFILWNKELYKKRTLVQTGREEIPTYMQLWKNSYPLLLVESMVFIGVWVDQMALGVLGTNEDVGIFNLCSKYVMLASLSLQAVNTISAPKFAEYFFKQDFGKLADNFTSTTRLIFWTAFPVIVAYIAFPHFFLSLFNDSFKGGSLTLIILALGSMINVMTGSVGTLLQMTKHQKTVQNVLLIGVTAELVLNLLLIPYLGVTGAAIASLGGSAIKNFGMSFYVKKYFGFNSIYIPFLSRING